MDDVNGVVGKFSRENIEKMIKDLTPKMPKSKQMIILGTADQIVRFQMDMEALFKSQFAIEPHLLQQGRLSSSGASLRPGGIEVRFVEKRSYFRVQKDSIGSFRMFFLKVSIHVLGFIQRISFSCYQKSMSMSQNMMEKLVRARIGNGISSSKKI